YLHPESSYLRIDSQGFTIVSLFRARSYRWSEVETFCMAKVKYGRFVVFDVSPTYRGRWLLRKINTAFSGYEELLPDTYGKSAKELAALLNAYKLRYDPRAPENG